MIQTDFERLYLVHKDISMQNRRRYGERNNMNNDDSGIVITETKQTLVKFSDTDTRNECLYSQTPTTDSVDDYDLNDTDSLDSLEYDDDVHVVNGIDVTYLTEKKPSCSYGNADIRTVTTTSSSDDEVDSLGDYSEDSLDYDLGMSGGSVGGSCGELGKSGGGEGMAWLGDEDEVEAEVFNYMTTTLKSDEKEEKDGRRTTVEEVSRWR